MIEIDGIKLPLESGKRELRRATAKKLGIREGEIKSAQIIKKAADARNKKNIFFVYNVLAETYSDEKKILSKAKSPAVYEPTPFRDEEPPIRRTSVLRPIVVGFGPAGFFAALTLARAGFNPIVLERGADADSRLKDVKAFWKERRLNPESNAQFGEGGAGTFSDGKLTTGIKDPLRLKAVEEFILHGAPPEVGYLSVPHIGTDRLPQIVKAFRREIISLGGEVRFGCKMTAPIIANGAVQGVSYVDSGGRSFDLETDALILCVGHSARDSIETLYKMGIKITQKAFSLGARIEHPRELIDRARYGEFAGRPELGAADYKLACHPEGGRGAYTFCMCPGGIVVNASSESGRLAVNGMSEYARDGENSNSALLVGVEPASFGGESPLAGIELQRKIEETAFLFGGGDYAAPCQTIGDFLKDRPSKKFSCVKPTCPTGATPSDIRKILPERVAETAARAIVKMDESLKGFALPDGLLTAPETRSSSPVRILRDEFYQSNVRGLYPCGEGSGYAGGIVSAATDGMRCARAVLAEESDRRF